MSVSWICRYLSSHLHKEFFSSLSANIAGQDGSSFPVIEGQPQVSSE